MTGPALLRTRPRLRPEAICIGAPVLLAVVVLLDVVAQHAGDSRLVTGLLDEPAHLATAALVLLALPPLPIRVTALVLAGSVGIDLDHVPLYLDVPHVAADGGRPFTHSLLTVALLLLVAGLAPALRQSLLALAGGVLLHFLRDIATGPGIPLLWPYDRAILVPYELYLAVLAALALAGVLKGWRGRRELGRDR